MSLTKTTLPEIDAVFDGTNKLVGFSGNDGIPQFLIGTGTEQAAALASALGTPSTLAGTSNQILINTAGSVATFSTPQDLATTSDIQFRDVTVRHLVRGTQTVPTIVAGTGAGTSPTVSVTGTDTLMVISITPGATPATAAVVVTITFNAAFAATPGYIFVPDNAATAALQSVAASFVSTSATTTTLVLTSGATGLTQSTAYRWRVLMMQ